MRFLSYVLIFLLFFAGNATFAANKYSIIPQPQSLIPQEGKFSLNTETKIVVTFADSRILQLAKDFAAQMKLVSGLRMEFVQSATKNAIIFKEDKTLAGEAYSLVVSPENITLKASTSNGVFYALQTIYQLMPAQVYGKKLMKQEWSVPGVSITDAPRFAYRGLHLDVSRHFFPISFVKKYIDAMAIHKLNKFHWHLTDDQGWRLEIKKYPLLTKVGSRRVESLVGLYAENYPKRYDDDAHGGYYTQDEAREIVRYAQERYITVIPEIEMPGHSSAAIASYPFLSCERKPIKVAKDWGVMKDVFCPRDSTFQFLENVLDEVMDIFPSEYIHIGGDECPKDRWRVCPDCQARIKAENLKGESGLQSYFIHRIEKYVNSKGRKIIGWDEILDGGLAPNATVMSWRGVNGGIAAAKAGHQVIMTPSAYCYFDHYQADPSTEPITIGGYLPLKNVYTYEPIPAELTPEEGKFILGAQGNVWAEYQKTTTDVEYMTFPRVAALAEVVWTNTNSKNWDRFRTSLGEQFLRYKQLGITPSKVFFDVSSRIESASEQQLKVVLETDNPDCEIRYTTDGSLPDKNSKLYDKAVVLTESSTIKAMAYKANQPLGKMFSKNFIVSKVTGCEYIQNPVNTWYRGQSTYALTDGEVGNAKSYGQWVAIRSVDGELIFDLKKQETITRLMVGLLNAPALNGYYPPLVTVSVSDDGVAYEQVSSENINSNRTMGTWSVYRPELVFPPVHARFVKLTLKNAGPGSNPDEEGGQSQIMMDEIGIW